MNSTDYKTIQVSRSLLHPNPWNPNKTTERQQEAIGESLALFGQVMPILVRPHPDIEGEYQIIDGEHRFNASGEHDVICHVIDLPDAKAKKLTIVMNETRGSADKIDLCQLLADIAQDDDDLLLALPFKQEELDELLNMAEVDWDQFNEAFSMGDDDSDSSGDQLSEDGWIAYFFKVPESARDVIEQAFDLLRDQGAGGHSDSAISTGQLVESLAAEYLAIPNS